MSRTGGARGTGGTNNSAGWASRGGCPSTNKFCFMTRLDAKRALKLMRQGVAAGETLNVYRCEKCGMYHVGHLPAWIVQERAQTDDRQMRELREISSPDEG